ncbi:hypothetical protein [Arthrobacter sp. JCM 19049]|uniref:hypothetical protein n=1 Tax=Arthrobacter sp. JCM 19049 TaxID=1460643 RepID=UPI0006D025C6|nr:hypothetical protein [Arthrobacter sp. JCM 19049]
MQNTSNNQDKANEQDAKLKDHVSDPKLSGDIGQDWTDEGGATHQARRPQPRRTPTNRRPRKTHGYRLHLPTGVTGRWSARLASGHWCQPLFVCGPLSA